MKHFDWLDKHFADQKEEDGFIEIDTGNKPEHFWLSCLIKRLIEFPLKTQFAVVSNKERIIFTINKLDKIDEPICENRWFKFENLQAYYKPVNLSTGSYLIAIGESYYGVDKM